VKVVVVCFGRYPGAGFEAVQCEVYLPKVGNYLTVKTYLHPNRRWSCDIPELI